MTLSKCLRSQGLNVVVDHFPDFSIHTVHPPERLADTDYATEIVDKCRPEIQGIIGSDVIRWEEHGLPHQSEDLKRDIGIGDYEQLFGIYSRNLSSNFERDFWHQDSGVSGLISLHHPTQPFSRLFGTLIANRSRFEAAFFKTLKELGREKRADIIKKFPTMSWSIGYEDLFERVDAEDFSSLAEREYFMYFVFELQKELIFTDQLDATLSSVVCCESWGKMNRTLTFHNLNTWHKRDFVRGRSQKNAGIILRKQY